MFGAWPDDWWRSQNIILLELYPIWLALRLWGREVGGSCLAIHTDNLALVPVLQKRCSRLHLANALLRDISLICMDHNILLRVEHIPGVDNYLADCLSRLQVDQFRRRSGDFMEQRPSMIPVAPLPSTCRSMLTIF